MNFVYKIYPKCARVLIVFWIYFLFSATSVYAQCAMCRAIPASNKAGGGNIANGLNTGILYMMAIPYIFLMLGVIYLYRKKIVQRFPVFQKILSF
jgi:hypothetical protein